MKTNREKASTHTGVSRSFANHADDLKLKLKVDEVPAHTLFQHNHSVGHDMSTWVCSKAFAVKEAYRRELEAEKAKGATEMKTPCTIRLLEARNGARCTGPERQRKFTMATIQSRPYAAEAVMGSRSMSRWTSCWKRSSHGKPSN